MKMRPLLLLVPLALWACQDTLYPVAPDVPERQTVGSPDPGSSPVTARGPYGGRLVKSGAYYLEFVGFTPANGSYTLYLFPWDASVNPIPRTGDPAEATLKLADGKTLAMAAATNSDDGSLFFYAFPEASFQTQITTVQAEVTLAGTPLSASFPHPDR